MQNAAAAGAKQPLLSPGAAHDHRAATEQVPRVANNVDATRHGGRSEWWPII